MSKLITIADLDQWGACRRDGQYDAETKWQLAWLRKRLSEGGRG